MPWGKRVTESFESNSTRPPHRWYIDEFTISRTVHSENGQISSCAFFLAFPLLRVFMATSHGKVHNPGSKSQPCTNTRHILPKLSSLGIGFQLNLEAENDGYAGGRSWYEEKTTRNWELYCAAFPIRCYICFEHVYFVSRRDEKRGNSFWDEDRFNNYICV